MDPNIISVEVEEPWFRIILESKRCTKSLLNEKCMNRWTGEWTDEYGGYLISYMVKIVAIDVVIQLLSRV